MTSLDSLENRDSVSREKSDPVIVLRSVRFTTYVTSKCGSLPEAALLNEQCYLLAHERRSRSEIEDRRRAPYHATINGLVCASRTRGQLIRGLGRRCGTD